MRWSAIQKCIDSAKREVNSLKSPESGATNESTNVLQLRQANYNLRIFQQELQVEEIVKMKTFKVTKINFFNNYFRIEN